jgi:3-oxoadipate CoA-transferase, alpha subunit
MRKKVYPTPDAAVADVPSGARIFFGGFGGAGFPNNLIQALDRQGARELTAITNNCGSRDGELGILFKHERIANVIASFPGPHANHFQELYAAGKVTLELVPQGILCERMRAAGAGIFGFYSAVGAGTEAAAGHEERIFDGHRTVFYEPLSAQFALIKAWKADELGNLVYRKTARNFNPIMAVAAKTTIVEVDEIVPVGALDPEQIVTPFVFVHRMVQVRGIHNVVKA